MAKLNFGGVEEEVVTREEYPLEKAVKTLSEEVIAILGYAVIKALSRNPSAASKIFMGMAIMLVFVEAISVVAILIIFQLFKK